MRHPFLVPDYPHFLHGGDYNPEQWLATPEILAEDLRLAKLAGVNSWSVGIFSWAALEPEEGHFTFDWLDGVLETMAAAGMKAVLATPSGAKPNWMAAKYPEIRRVQASGNREPQGGRHNHCFTSPVYREKVSLINTRLAERYQNHPALGVWHLSNEYSGECHCPLCKDAFRLWLQKKYGTLEKLNHAWWSAFWSHSYTAWEQIDWLDGSVHGFLLDWRRFTSDQTADFIRCEAAPLRRLTPNIPITTNLMGGFFPLDYRRLARELDLVSWDNYPAYHSRENMAAIASSTGFTHDLMRGLKRGRPFMLMESSPSAVNWMAINKLLRPGVHRLKSIQAVAHGADSVQYFQYRKSRGSCEKFHGAVVDHVGHEHTRVFGEVAQVGKDLKKLEKVLGSTVPAEVAILYDWENRWILEEAAGPRKGLYDAYVDDHYRVFWRRGVSVDIVSAEDDLSGYRLVVAPMLYMLKPGVAESLQGFVEKGGTLFGGFLSGISDENDLVFLGGWPGPLRKLYGVWAEEIDYLYDDESNRLVPAEGCPFKSEAKARLACDLIHAESAKVLATYGDDFYAGRPVLTVNAFGQGKAYYLAARIEAAGLDELLGGIAGELRLKRALECHLPEGVTAQLRSDGKEEYIFVMNFTGQEKAMELPKGFFADLLEGGSVSGRLSLGAYGCRVLARSG